VGEMVVSVNEQLPVTDGTLYQFSIGGPMTADTLCVGDILECIECVRHGGGAVVTALTFFNAEPFGVVDAVTVGIGAVVTGPAFHAYLMGSMGKHRWPGSLGRINGGLKKHCISTFLSGSPCQTDIANCAATRQDNPID
jgi:hypothetical protein